jgi:hypothetical protein
MRFGRELLVDFPASPLATTSLAGFLLDHLLVDLDFDFRRHP